MIDTYPIKPSFTLIYFYFSFFLFFFSTTLFVSPLHLSSPIHLLLLSFFLFFYFFIFIFFNFYVLPYETLGSTSLSSNFFFIAFFSNSVRLLLDFPTINPVFLPQKNFMFSHMFLWVFILLFYFIYFLCTSVGCFSVRWFFFFGCIDVNRFL